MVEKEERLQTKGMGQMLSNSSVNSQKEKKKKNNLRVFLLPSPSTYSMFGLLFTLEWGRKLFYYLVPDISNVLGTILVSNIREWEEEG